MNKHTYSYKDSGNIQHTIELENSDFEFVQQDKNIHDIKFKTKPTTFFKDALKRFTKNKSSVVGAIILGLLLLFSFTLPYIIPYDVDSPHTEASFLEPKLFDAGVGFWDGTKRMEYKVCSTKKVSEESNNDSNYKNTVWSEEEEYYYPAGYSFRAVMNLSKAEMSYTDQASEYTQGGYVRIINNSDASENIDVNYESSLLSLDLNNDITVKYTLGDGKEDEDYENSNYSFFVRLYESSDNFKEYEIASGLVNEENSQEFNIKSTLNDIDSSLIKAYYGVVFGFKVKANENNNAALYIESVSLSSSDSNENALLSDLSFEDGNSIIYRYQQTTNVSEAKNLWDSDSELKKYGGYSLFMGRAYVCSFTLDTYENKLGVKDDISIGESTLRRYCGYSLAMDGVTYYLDSSLPVLCEFNFDLKDSDEAIASFKRISSSCPVLAITSKKTTTAAGITTTNYTCKVNYYQYMGYGDSMPRFIFGTDSKGHDMLKITFTGLRTSLLLGIFTFVICFTFGLVLGAIEGYYGGWVDIVLQRLTEILSGIPWIVLMTLIILLAGSNFWTFALALCLTGWIGTSNLTRTQFYRFKGREYILASRTLGSSDMRLIFKHILPNSMGTIITSSVLMIPSVIFSEATISYLGLGLKNMNSLGIILSDNQANLQYYPFTLIVPAVVIALLMICFNLFGNGLRDAFNPSLKGSD